MTTIVLKYLACLLPIFCEKIPNLVIRPTELQTETKILVITAILVKLSALLNMFWYCWAYSTCCLGMRV